MAGIGSWTKFAHPMTATAMGLLVRSLLDGPPDARQAESDEELLECEHADWKTGPIDFVAAFLGAHALPELQGATKRFRSEWRNQILTILPLQDISADPRLRGSWEPVDRWSEEGGRVYATAINALTLALCAKR